MCVTVFSVTTGEVEDAVSIGPDLLVRMCEDSCVLVCSCWLNLTREFEIADNYFSLSSFTFFFCRNEISACSLESGAKELKGFCEQRL